MLLELDAKLRERMACVSRFPLIRGSHAILLGLQRIRVRPEAFMDFNARQRKPSCQLLIYRFNPATLESKETGRERSSGYSQPLPVAD
jgi:hypothetical protein